jgi:hypothetical protein
LGRGIAEAAERWLARRCEELEEAAAAIPAKAMARAKMRTAVFIEGNLIKRDSEARKSLRK